MDLPVAHLLENCATLTERLQGMHGRILEAFPSVERVACALYQPDEDTLRTFINSTRGGEPLTGYQYRLSDSPSLSEMARSGTCRVIDDLQTSAHGHTAHARWLREQGYRSSFTVPLHEGSSFLGLVFFDSSQPAAFTTPVQQALELYCGLIALSISNEFSAVRTLIASVRVARELTEVRDFETGTHLERMARYSLLIAQEVAPAQGLGDEFIESVHLFAALHDIGKIGIPDQVLLKPGPLDPEEIRIMRSHVEKGVRIVDRILGNQDRHLMPNAAILRNIVQHHHEWLDGSGYPAGLRGDAIPLEARIVTVADIYDALTTQRPYKRVWTQAAALAELSQLAAQGKLDARCVAVLTAHAAEAAAIQARYSDSSD